MKKFALWVTLVILLPLQAQAVEKWIEGTHYKELNQPVTDSPVIMEFFSYWCAHCYRTEPFVAELKKSLNDGVKFKKVHVNFMPNASQETQDQATKGLFIAQALKAEDKLSGAIFNYLHRQRASVTSIKDIRNIFIINGIDGEKFDKLASSYGIRSKMGGNEKLLEQYRRDVNSVPTFIVNGKYLVQFTRGQTNQDRIDLLNFLAGFKD